MTPGSRFAGILGVGVSVLGLYWISRDALRPKSPAPASPLAHEAAQPGVAPGAGEAREIKSSPANAHPVSFNEDIQPILSENCYQCHGADASSRKAELRLDRREFALAPRKEGPAIVAGDPERSPLIQRIESTKADQRMPPPESHKVLRPGEISRLRQWVREGAVYEEHWAYLKPVRPAVPAVRDQQWPRNAIDHFVAERLDQEGLTPAPEADRLALIRRVSFDLTGLPPTAEEIAAFQDDDSPQAYERVVDRLLASPRYGEHRAHYWLDAARVGDTHGLHRDNYRASWPYRDYVIRAFNRNTPFDQFAREQIAGDLYPARDFDQWVATGFSRAILTTSESGEITELLQASNVADRLETVCALFLGMTASCASCHDHKFDPLSQKEFYQLSAFFNNSIDPPFDDEEAAFPPTIALPAAGRESEGAALLRERAAAEERLTARERLFPELIPAWVRAGTPGLRPEVSPERWLARLKLDEGRGAAVLNSAPGAATASFVATGAEPIWGEYLQHWPALRFAPSTRLSLGNLGDFEYSDAFSVAGWFQPRVGRRQVRGALLSKMSLAGQLRGWELYWDSASKPTPKYQRWPEGRIAVNLFHADAAQGLSVRTKADVARFEWLHLAFSYDGSGRASGVRLYINGEPQETEVLRDHLEGASIRTEAPLELGRRASQGAIEDKNPLIEAAFQDVRLYGRKLVDDEIRGTMWDDVVRAIVRLPAERWSADQRAVVTRFFQTCIDETCREARAAIRALDQRLATTGQGGVKAMVMRERTTPALAYVLDRGQYNRRKERVSPEVPAFLPRLPAGAPANRLGLADWLVSPEHPLTARVAVNRMWQEIFGTGLVATARDFGVVGARPSHPRLLDWLAVDFRENGWDVKRFYRQVVLSATYRQSARLTPELIEKDPGNRLLARGPRFRLDAEEIRDQALFSSGLLVEKTGGPSVHTYQPPGLWEAMSMDGSNTRTQTRDQGPDLYRRSIYTFWKRISPPPVMTTFDAPPRDTCVIQRDRTNTPLQALLTMNAPDFLEAARHLSAQAMRRPDASAAQRVDFMAQRVLTRPLTAKDRGVLLESYEAMKGSFSETEAREFLAVGDSPVDSGLPPQEHAAWMVVASQLLNTDQALNK